MLDVLAIQLYTINMYNTIYMNMLYIVYIAINSCLVLLFCDRQTFVHKKHKDTYIYNKYDKTKT